MDDVLETDWSKARQLQILEEIPPYTLYKQHFPGLENIMSYLGCKVDPRDEVLALSYEPNLCLRLIPKLL